MSIEKALKAKNSGVFIENLQIAYLKKSQKEVLDAIANAPTLKWSAETEINKLGLMLWCDKGHIEGLKSKIQDLTEENEYRSAMIGCLYLFGANFSAEAIELSEMNFSAVESSSDYEFYVTSVLSCLIGSSLEWKGAPSGKCFIAVDKEYLISTITSIVDDLRASERLFQEGYVVEFASGLAKAGGNEKSHQLLTEYLENISDFSDIESFMYCLTKTIPGLPPVSQSLEVAEVDFVNASFLRDCLEKAKKSAKESDADSLDELIKYVGEF